MLCIVLYLILFLYCVLLKKRIEYLNKLAAGDKSVKINAATNFPHDIVHKYREESCNKYCYK